jgi:hypothetical protein
VAVTAFQDERLSLQPCSSPGTTVWILDFADSPATAPAYFPIVNGSDTHFVHPFAMTILGDPAHQPFTPIIMQHLTGNRRRPRHGSAAGHRRRGAAPGRRVHPDAVEAALT